MIPEKVAGAADTASVERKNFFLNSIEGAIFISSGAFINAQTVLPALVVKLGGSNVVVGALGVLVYFGLFMPQIFSARYVETLPWKKRWTIRMGAIHRSFVLVIGLVILFLGAEHPTAALWLFMILFTLMQMIVGVATTGWFDMFAKLTPSRKRGRLVGVRNSLGGVASFVCGLGLIWLLGNLPFPSNFAVAFFAAFVLQVASLVTQTGLVESEMSVTSHRRPIFDFLKELPDLFRENPAFRNFIISSALLTIAAMPIGLFTAYALTRFNADEAAVGQFTLTMVAIQVLSALVNGVIADRYGNKQALLIAAIALLLASLTALLAPTLAWFRLVYLFLGVNLGTEMMARYTICIEYATARRRSTYVGMMNVILAPFYLSGLIGGALSEWLGFGALFGLSACFSVAGMTYLIRRVSDPRRAQTAVAPG